MMKSFCGFLFIYVDPFRRYWRSKSKVVKNCERKFDDFLPSQIFGAGIAKIVPILSPCLAGRRLKKVIESNTLNFRPDF